MAVYYKEVDFWGKAGIIRNAEKADAAELIGLLNLIDTQTTFLTREPGEFTMTVEQEEAYLTRVKDSEKEISLLAVADGKIVGICGCTGHGQKKRMRHVGGLGICIEKSYWSMGIGRALMEAAIAWGREVGFTRFELEVDSGNERAIGLYKSLSFEFEGRRRRAMRMADGSFRDNDIMGLLFDV